MEREVAMRRRTASYPINIPALPWCTVELCWRRHPALSLSLSTTTVEQHHSTMNRQSTAKRWSRRPDQPREALSVRSGQRGQGPRLQLSNLMGGCPVPSYTPTHHTTPHTPLCFTQSQNAPVAPKARLLRLRVCWGGDMVTRSRGLCRMPP